MGLPDHWDVGTASVANGATTVTYSGTTFGSVSDPIFVTGDLHCDPAQPLVPPQRLASFDPTTGIGELWAPWPGTSMVDAPYEVRYIGDSVRSSALNRKLLEQMRAIEANGRGLFYLFNDGTSDADPGSGYIAFDDVDLTAAAEAYLDNLDANGATVSAILDTWDDSTSTTKGQLWIRGIADPSAFRAYNATGSVVDGTGYRKLTLTHIGGSGSFAADDELMVFFSPTGNVGTGITQASSSGPASLALAEDADNGTNKITVTVPSSLAADRTFTLPDANITLTSFISALLNSSTAGGALAAISGFGVVRAQVFTSSGTYTPNANMVYCVIEAIGGGGGSGPAVAQANLNGGSSGGGAGSRSITVASAATVGASQTVTIGAGGTAGVVAGPVAGGNGGDTSVGSLCIGKGGSGSATIGTSSATGAAGGVAGTGTITAPGAPGYPGQVAVRSQASISSGSGGSTIYGAGGRGIGGNTSSTGLSGSGYGSGAGGGFYYSDTVSGAGQAGQGGIVVIWEYCAA